ncbi:MAG: CDP-alcohol phosphatidyltransferase family protein [Clostridiales bacterium]|nr:CDP-alcohol phosphatidyltransferase family protein [Clostridiales bacterium]
MIKKVPNILSVTRIAGALSLVLFAVLNLNAVYVVVYIVCGITDVLDGTIARRYNATSKLGATLDTAGDLLLIFSAFFSALFILGLYKTIKFGVLLWAISALLFRVFNLILTRIKFKFWNGMHTYATKIAGAVTFFIVPVSVIMGRIYEPLVIALSVLINIASAEETLLLLTRSSYDVNAKGYFFDGKSKAGGTDEKEKSAGIETLNSDGEAESGCEKGAEKTE